MGQPTGKIIGQPIECSASHGTAHIMLYLHTIGCSIRCPMDARSRRAHRLSLRMSHRISHSNINPMGYPEAASYQV